MAYVNTIDYITMGSTGNATDFGDLTVSRWMGEGNAGSSTRGLFTGGSVPGTASNVIDYITIASTGDATDFGDLTVARGYMATGSNNTRCTWGGGHPSSNVIDYVTIASTGDAADFGDMTSAKYTVGGFSNGHGGLTG